jgi:hypothetical protein
VNDRLKTNFAGKTRQAFPELRADNVICSKMVAGKENLEAITLGENAPEELENVVEV